MGNISQYLSNDHGTCDELYSSLENIVTKGDWEKTHKKAQVFFDAMEQHFALEEEILFPTLEDYTGMTMGPTAVMRMEHKQMRVLMKEMQEALAEKNKDTVLGSGETLLILIQQHNMKEENILYPMADDALSEEANEIVQRMDELRTKMS